MAGLCGKGVWLAHSYDLQRAVEMATKIEGNTLLVKVGHGPHYFPETARELVQRIRSLGFHPLAWIHVTDRVPQDALRAITQADALGYEGIVLFLGAGLVTATQLGPLASALQKAEVSSQKLWLASASPAYLPDAHVLEVFAPLCQGGWMPLCFPQPDTTPAQVIDAAYQALGDLSLWWGGTPAVYPVLSPLSSQRATELFLPEDLIPWIEGIIQHGVDFFSMYHVAATEKALWPILQSAVVTCQAEAEPSVELTEPGTVVPQPVYVTVTTSDTVWGLIARYGMTKAQFWQWNEHLWVSRGLPRDPDYLQEGWRVRVK